MRRLVRPLLFTALATCCATAFAATADQAPQGRLPGWAIPQSYQIAFKVDPAQQDFSGTTTIKVKLTKASDHLWLDGKELKVSKVTITDAAGKQHEGKYVDVDSRAGVVRVDFGSMLKPQELRLKGSQSGKNYIGPAGPVGGEKDREIVSFDGRVLMTRFIDKDASSRYGTMVYVRCAPRA